MRKRLLRAGFILAVAVAVVLGCWAWAVVTPAVGDALRIPVATGANSQPAVPPKSRESWSFGFVGDTQQGEGIYDRIFAQMQEAGVEFVLHLGDLVEEAESDREWDALLEQAIRHRIRLMPVVGNHDTLEAYGDRGEIRFRQYFPYLPETFYHFRHRGMNFLMLNSERSLAPGSQQGRFLRWQLRAHPGPTVVCLHRPVFTCGTRGWKGQYLRRLWLHGGLKGSDAVLVLAGHHHYYDRTKPLDGITYVVSGGGGRKLYHAEPPDAYTASFRAGASHYGIVDVFPEHMEARVVTTAGDQIDAFAVALQPARAEPGQPGNWFATELPPLDVLPSYEAAALSARVSSSLPRPW